MIRNGHKVEKILESLLRTSRDEGEVSVGHMIEAMGDRGWGPLLFAPAMIEISPIGGVPGIPTMIALIIALFAVQIAAGRDHMWLPGFLSRRSVSGEKLRGAVETLRPLGRWLDRWFHRRLPRFTGDGATRSAACVVIALCLTVPPLELVPFASTLPMAAIALFGLGLLLTDGLLMLAGFVGSLAAFVVGLGALLGG